MVSTKAVGRKKCTLIPFKTLSKKLLQQMAGNRYYARGIDYYRSGNVRSLRYWKNEAHAIVQGVEDYDVWLWDHAGKFGGFCSCPGFEEFGYCKHFVAAGLTLLDSFKTDMELTILGPKKKVGVSMTMLEKFLGNLEKSQLVDWLMRAALKDNELFKFLYAGPRKGENMPLISEKEYE